MNGKERVIDIAISILLLATSLYFLFMSTYYMYLSMPATSITSLIIGLILLVASLHVYILVKNSTKK